MKIRKNDIILIGILLAAAAILFLCTLNRQPGAYVIVRTDGSESGCYSLSESGRYELNGGTNILVIENGCAYMEYANCPDKVCVNQGKINCTGECITCLPNKITVTVYGAESGVDIMVG